MAYDPSIFNISPYYDDYDPDNGFLRILFKPGYAVQARELTQLQSILQNQISKIGDHLFKDGSRIVGAPITVRNTNFLGLRTGTGTPFSAFGTDDWSSLVNSTIYWGATASGKIAHVLPPETDDKLFVVVDYVSGYSQQIPITGVTVGITTSNGVGYSPFVPSGSTHNGLCKLVTVGDGIFYVDGMFVLNNEQSFTPFVVSGGYRDLSCSSGGVTFAGLDKKVGLSINRDTTTSSENTSLLDPSFGSPNYKAPGADRFVVNLELDQTDLNTTPDDFVELLKFEDGLVTKKIDKVVYGDIAKTLAQRTYDESGSYLVSPFDISVREASSPENLNLIIGPGKAYVYGTEIETKYPTILGISKGRSVDSSVNDASFIFNTGNVLGVCLDRTASGTTAYTYFNNVNGGSGLVRFRNIGGSVIGEARIHGLIPRNSGVTSSLYSMYLYGVCGGSIISGASSAAVYGSPGGASAGITFGVFYPINGSTFGLIGGSAANDSCLVYEIAPTQGVSAFTEFSFYGKISTKSSASWVTGVTYSSTNQSTTYTVENSDLDLPSGFPTSNISLISELLSTPSSSVSLLSNYNLVNNTGIVMSPSSLFASNGNAGVSVKKDGSNRVSLVTQNTPIGFTGAAGSAVRMILPYKYTVSSSNFSTASGVSGSCRTKTATTNTINSTVFNITNINGRYGFTLPHWDVYSVRGITIGGSSVLTDFELDDGQKESFYDYSAIVAKKTKESTYASTSQTVSVTYNYFRHGGTVFAPFVGYHSYIGISYDQVPLFTNPKTGRTVSLSNCIDFRHSGPTLDTINAKPYGDYESLNPTNAKWYNYLPRIDRVGIKVNPSDLSTTFMVDKGISELAPQSPPETENSMTLATVMVPAFTYRPTDVVVNRTNVRRYSMSDINNVEKRIDDMEVFTKLSLSESEMASENVKPIIDGFIANGGSTSGIYSLTSEPIKTSIYTDDFYGHAGGDVSDKEHRCSVDYQYGELRPMFEHKFFSLSAPTVSTGATVSSDGLVTLDYTTSAHITNDGYNKSIAVNPTGTVNWLGFIKFTEGYKTTFDTGVRPVVYNNNMMENDNWIGSNANNARGFGTQWNDWEYLWSGSQIRTDQKDDIQKRILETPRTNSPSLIPTVNSGNEKTSVARDFYQPDRKLGNLLNSSRLVGRSVYRTPDNRIVDKTVVPYIPLPSTPIGITAHGLRPNSSGLNLYVDGVLVKSGLTTNSNGTVGLTFTFSSGTYTSGEKAVRISDSANSQNATQAADAIYYCGGTVRQRFDGVYSTRNPEYRRQTVTSEGIIKDPFNREVSYDNIQETITSNSWTDPMCQTFIVDKKGYPEGIFVSSIKLYFDTKDSNLPVTIQLRPTINGYPSPSVSFPFSTVTLMPSQVNTGYVGNSTTPVATEFKFTSPVYLEPGEYAIAILTNSKDYTIRAYDSGLNLTNTGRGGNPAVGTLYSPQSMGTAVPDLNTDISFSVNRCEFTISSSSDVSYTGLDVANCQVLKVSVPQIVPTNTSSSISMDSGTKTILNNQNEYLNTVYTTTKDIKFSMTKQSKNYISPAIDTGVFFGVGASMIVTDNTSLASPTSSYVSKVISLPEELISTGVFASAEVCCPYRSELRAYIRFIERGESDLFSKDWVQMVAIGGIGSYKYPFTASSNLSSTEFDFRPTQWAYFNTSSNIRAYQIKLVMTTSTTDATKTYSVLPSVRNMRMASLRIV